MNTYHFALNIVQTNKNFRYISKKVPLCTFFCLSFDMSRCLIATKKQGSLLHLYFVVVVALSSTVVVIVFRWYFAQQLQQQQKMQFLYLISIINIYVC